MAKKQTRRSISVKGTTYEALRIHCADRSLSMSEFVEQRIAEYFAREGIVVAPVRSATAKTLPGASHIDARPTARAALRLHDPQPRAVDTLRADPRRASATRSAETDAPRRTSSSNDRKRASAPAPRIEPARRDAAPTRSREAARLVEAAPVPRREPIRLAPATRPEPVRIAPAAPRPSETARAIQVTAPAAAPAAAPALRSVGRPAPTPAAQILKVYKSSDDGAADRTDYRAIRF